MFDAARHFRTFTQSSQVSVRTPQIGSSKRLKRLSRDVGRGEVWTREATLHLECSGTGACDSLLLGNACGVCASVEEGNLLLKFE